jgi:hypothetical protein
MDGHGVGGQSRLRLRQGGAREHGGDGLPATLIAERGDQVSLMVLQPSASGARYQGRNESLWEHQGNALITRGYGAQEMSCRIER